MIYLDLDDLLHIAGTVLPSLDVRDIGLLESALARPQASAFGSDAYPELHTKAAALLHSVASNHGLVDGNMRLALAATIAFHCLGEIATAMTRRPSAVAKSRPNAPYRSFPSRSRCARLT